MEDSIDLKAAIAGPPGKVLSHLPEVLLLGGATALVYGAWLVYRPAGWLVAGALLLFAGWRLGRVIGG